MVDAGIAVFTIFDPREAFLEAYFEPATAERLRPGMKAEVRLPGFARALTLPVSSIDTVITKRPGTDPLFLAARAVDPVPAGALRPARPAR